MQVQALGPREPAALYPSISHQGSEEDTQQRFYLPAANHFSQLQSPEALVHLLGSSISGQRLSVHSHGLTDVPVRVAPTSEAQPARPEECSLPCSKAGCTTFFSFCYANVVNRLYTDFLPQHDTSVCICSDLPRCMTYPLMHLWMHTCCSCPQHPPARGCSAEPPLHSTNTVQELVSLFSQHQEHFPVPTSIRLNGTEAWGHREGDGEGWGGNDCLRICSSEMVPSDNCCRKGCAEDRACLNKPGGDAHREHSERGWRMIPQTTYLHSLATKPDFLPCALCVSDPQLSVPLALQCSSHLPFLLQVSSIALPNTHHFIYMIPTILWHLTGLKMLYLHYSWVISMLSCPKHSAKLAHCRRVL